MAIPSLTIVRPLPPISLGPAWFRPASARLIPARFPGRRLFRQTSAPLPLSSRSICASARRLGSDQRLKPSTAIRRRVGNAPSVRVARREAVVLAVTVEEVPGAGALAALAVHLAVLNG